MSSDWKRILFLDIDMVLSSEEWFNRTKGRSGMIDPELVKLINQLKDINVEVVISSSWGYDNGRTEKTLQEVGFELPIIGYTEHFYVEWMCRGNEILKWLCKNMGSFSEGIKYDSKYYQKDYEYVIFDDDTDFLLGQKDNFIHINRNTGLTQADIDKAIKILTRNDN